jgi:uncharacterized protein (DUF2236 family)
MEGLFGPESAVWVLHSDASGLVGGLRALAVQALEPRALAGVKQFSAFTEDPDRRLAETIDFMDLVTYGTLEEVDRGIAWVRRLHERVVGVDPVSGLPFDANDPYLLAFVHNALVESIVVAYRTFHPEKPAALLERYVLEMRRFAERIGADMSEVPSSVAALTRWVWAVPTLTVSDATRDAYRVLAVRRLENPIGVVYPLVMEWVISSLPEWVTWSLGVRPDPLKAGLAWAAVKLVGDLARLVVPPSPRRQRAMERDAAA